MMGTGVTCIPKFQKTRPPCFMRATASELLEPVDTFGVGAAWPRGYKT